MTFKKNKEKKIFHLCWIQHSYISLQNYYIYPPRHMTRALEKIIELHEENE